MPKPAPALIWFRRDLRLADNPALSAAVAGGKRVVPLYILDEESEGVCPPGGASRWWLHHSLTALGDALVARGASLVLRRGPAARVIREVLKDTGADAVFWNRLYDPGSVVRDTAIRQSLADAGIAAESHNASLLIEPWKIATKAGAPFRVFTPFWKALRQRDDIGHPLPAPERPRQHARTRDPPPAAEALALSVTLALRAPYHP
jgi:deoxyribodipyrimidine photo-lyase